MIPPLRIILNAEQQAVQRYGPGMHTVVHVSDWARTVFVLIITSARPYVLMIIRSLLTAPHATTSSCISRIVG